MIGKKLLKKIKVAHAIWRDNWQYSGSYTREGAIKKARIPLFFDMLYSELTTGSDPHNYYMFYFENLSQQERRKWITNHVNAHTAARHSGKEIWNLFEDKAKFNARFKDYVKRRWLDTRTSSSGLSLPWSCSSTVPRPNSCSGRWMPVWKTSALIGTTASSTSRQPTTRLTMRRGTSRTAPRPS